jgi:tetratricopeptide (TPR) repeat protein
MTDQQAVFQEWMEKGHNAAWDQDWAAAMQAYLAALKIQPSSPEAHIDLGQALMLDGQLDRAMVVYERAAKLAPDDPAPLEGAADVLERQGRLHEAATRYIQVSEVYLARQDINRAIGNWERATQLSPGLVSVHARLAQAYERIGETVRAIQQYIVLAVNFYRKGDRDKAVRAVERALRIDPKNPQALNILQAIQAGGDVAMPVLTPGESRPSTGTFGFGDIRQADESVAHADPRGPLGESLAEALNIVANYVVERGTAGLDSAFAYALQGMTQQRQGLDAEAIAAYEQAIAGGMEHPGIQHCLGGLLVFSQRGAEAIRYLRGALGETALKAGTEHGLGLAYFQTGDQREAAAYLVQSLHTVDVVMAVDLVETKELNSVYDGLKTAIDGRSDGDLARVNERFIDLLSGEDWKQRIAETRRQLHDTFTGEGEAGMVDILVAKGGEELAEMVSGIDRSIRRGLLTLAMEQCHYAIERSPYYLPVHVRIAEILLKEGRIHQAINKYNIVARAYLARSENDRAATILAEVLDIAPLNAEVRLSLIELLEQEDRMQEALEQYVELANTYRQLGDFEQAIETYNASQQLAHRIRAPKATVVAIKQRIADIAQMRGNVRLATRYYEEIRELEPQNVEAARVLVELYYTQGNTLEGVKQLDSVLHLYAEARMYNQMIRILEEMVQEYPQDMPLRSRLGMFYRKLGRQREAIAQLDALGELQIGAGMNKEAVQTLRRIISLNPDRAGDYRKLLAQLERTL